MEWGNGEVSRTGSLDKSSAVRFCFETRGGGIKVSEVGEVHEDPVQRTSGVCARARVCMWQGTKRLVPPFERIFLSGLGWVGLDRGCGGLMGLGEEVKNVHLIRESGRAVCRVA